MDDFYREQETPMEMRGLEINYPGEEKAFGKPVPVAPPVRPKEIEDGVRTSKIPLRFGVSR